jgi:hypothetical protein
VDNYEAFPYFQVLVLGLLFDVGVLVVVIAHIRFVASLNGQIMALEASTDLLLQSQRELNKLIVLFLSKSS